MEIIPKINYYLEKRGDTQMLKFTSTDKAPAAIGPYSQAVEANGFLFTSGQVALMPGTGEIVGTTIEEQAERVCQSLKAILDANGIGFENVVKTTCFLADMNDFGKFNEVYGKYFTSKPARSCVAVKTLPKNLLCEVEVVAAMK
jgi:2-iminobutanoate/2-iminopropanoate deaminase